MRVLQTLVGAACIAVLAFVGYYFYGEYRRHQDAEDARLAAAYEQTITKQVECEKLGRNCPPGTPAAASHTP